MGDYLDVRLKAILDQLQAAHSGGDAMSSATRGSEREAFIDLLLRGCLPSPYRFGSGEIIDAYGERSGQVDLVIEYPFFPSFPLLGTAQHRLYLIEAIAMAIEVKSHCDQFADAVGTMNKVRALVPNAEWPKPAPGAPPIKWAWHGARGQGAFTSFPGRVGFAVVMYEGWKTATTLQQRCDADGVDVALQIAPPIFYARHYRRLVVDKAPNPKIVEGTNALAAFLCVVTEELRALGHWELDAFRTYFERKSKDSP